MSWISKLGACFYWKNSVSYTILTKKDDDFGLVLAEQWIKAHPIDRIQREIRYSNLDKISAYANEAIQNLKKVPITSSTLEVLKPHLIEMSKRSDNLKQALMKNIQYLPADQKFKTCIIDALSSIFEIPEFKQKESWR